MSDPRNKEGLQTDQDLEALLHDPDGHAVVVALPDGRIVDEAMIRGRRIPTANFTRIRLEVELLARGLEDPGKISRNLARVRHGVITLIDHPDRKWAKTEMRLIGEDDHDLTVSAGQKNIILYYGVERARVEGIPPPIPREMYEHLPGASVGSSEEYRARQRKLYGGHPPEETEEPK